IYDFESNIRNKDGSMTPIKLNAAVLRNEEREAIGGVVSFRNISDIELLCSSIVRESQYYGIIGHSKAMSEVFQLIEEISDSDATVLIQGESGTGKEMVANAIQQSSLRKNKPFIKVNCSVFTPQLLASELFGHVKGSFTGAIKDRPGRFEVADTGTLFLDEVAETPLQMQLQLLRVLQEGTFERVGESITHKVDVRVIAATNTDLTEAIKQGNFRDDLYYRLNVIPIEIPPLRERTEDLPHLIKYFMNKFSVIYKKIINDIDDQALDMLLNYDWPGNVRELENVIEYAFVRSKDSNVILKSKLPLSVRQHFSIPAAIPRISYIKSSNDEKTILHLLEKYQWNKTKVARELGIGRTTLWRKLKQMGVKTN
ncbi:sigma-54-dependent Fis family transcriptional regulator, partial [candidate division KSB1 bacterium 4572_119]